ncbi:MAG: hypothetical protein PHI96_09655 [Desulfovibrio sp.]|nr:hypothetical protein [Desulfovibrio sp.]
MQPHLPQDITVLSVSGLGSVANRPRESGHVYRELFALPLGPTEGYEGYWHTQAVDGAAVFTLPGRAAGATCSGCNP